MYFRIASPLLAFKTTAEGKLENLILLQSYILEKAAINSFRYFFD